MKVTYQLSQRQRKELLERGRPLSIAIPAPDENDYDPVEFVRRALPEVERSWIVSASEVSLPVSTHVRPAGDMSGKIGEIQHGEHDTDKWHVLIVCVVVELQAERVARHSKLLTQWPGSVEWH